MSRAGVVALLLVATPALAGVGDPLEARLDRQVLQAAFPGADAIGEIAGEPPLAEVIFDGEVVGHLFSTYDMLGTVGYAGEPFDLVVGLDRDGRVRGVVLVEHHEPIIGPSMIRWDLVQSFLDQLADIPVTRSLRARLRGVDGLSGATVTAKLMRSAALISARTVARRLGMLDEQVSQGGLALDLERFEENRWSDLVAAGAVTGLRLTDGEIARAFGRADAGPDDDTFIELYAMLATPAGIGGNALGNSWHQYSLSQIDPDDQLLVLAALGRYKFLGSSSPIRDVFRRVRVVQDGQAFKLSYDNMLKRTAIRAFGAPRLREIGLFRISRDSGFDPLKQWSLELAVEAEAVGANGDPAVFSLPYRIPAEYVLGEDYALEEAGFKEPNYALFGLVRQSRLNEWQQAWVERAADIAILAGLLVSLTLVLVFQDAVARQRRLHETIRIGFLGVVLVWLGWLKDAQLTTINVITYARAAVRELDWTPLLIDPLIFLLSVYVAVSLVLWGRGVFCGWLCPFGALQELLNRLARAVRVRQLAVPEVLQERLWAIKYVVAIVVFALAAWSMDAAIKAAEVEPFKTAIIVGLDRSWPYLAYAGVLLGVGLTIERFFCRFLCPLGAALGLLGRARLLNWLKRRPQCGNPCAICQASCPLGAIRGDGGIDLNECLQCLDCQVDYYDSGVCPPLVARRKRYERLAAEAPALAAGG